MSTDKQVAFITGANRGIGRETARELGELGLTVVLGSRELAKGEAAAADLRAQGLDAEAVHFDALRPQTFDTVFSHLEKRYGKLDILVNNAGINPGNPGSKSARSVSSEILREIFETNFIAVVALTQKLLPLLEKSSSARIVNVSSIVGSLALQSMPHSPIEAAKDFGYNASKTALNAFTIHLAYDLRDTPIKVFSADPGWVKTDMGGPHALLELSEGGKSTAQIANFPPAVPSGGFFRGSEGIVW
jgi:NAD(P)-dependent dehydrogenase (short-subunit alcohol dehydrogenase family)